MENKVFYEEIYYCPSQIYYYFELPSGEKKCLYLRQRGLPYMTAEVACCDEFWSLSYSAGDWELLPLPKIYDLNGQENQEDEDKLILEVETKALELLREKYPDIEFPDNPRRETERLDLSDLTVEDLKK